MLFPPIDLTNQRFGKLVALEPTSLRKKKSVVWRCLCDCGKETFVLANSLMSGNTKSCGCSRGVDVSGKRFGKLMAIEPTTERRHGSIVWRCKCDCGNEVFTSAQILNRGDCVSCGCKRHNEEYSNLIGKKFGKLTVVKGDGSKDTNRKKWLCRCDCGNEVWVRALGLVMGHTSSCGCARWTDIAGYRFGTLTAIAPTEQRKNGSVVWKCLCDCGNEVFLSKRYLKPGSVRTCGINHEKNISTNVPAKIRYKGQEGI